MAMLRRRMGAPDDKTRIAVVASEGVVFGIGRMDEILLGGKVSRLKPDPFPHSQVTPFQPARPRFESIWYGF